MEAAGATLLILGAVSIIAALVGGSLKLLGDTEFPPLKSPIIRVLLGIVGSFFVLWGLVLVVGLDSATPPDNSEASQTPPAVRSEDEVMAYTTRLNDICIARGEDLASLNQPNRDDHQSIVDWLYQTSVIYAGWRNEINAVTRPAGAINAALREILEQHDILAAATDGMYQAAAARDEALYRRHLIALTQATDTLGAAFRAYGMNCPY